MSGSEKKVSENTYDISSIKRVTKTFVVSEIVKMNGQESVNSYRENTKK